MEASEMLDVLHFYMEQDFDYTTKEESEAKENLRATINNLIYEADDDNFFGTKTKGSRTYINKNVDQEIKPFDPDDTAAFRKKSYIPPTDFDENSSKPFGDVLDSPLG